jgi:hypothetical protein
VNDVIQFKTKYELSMLIYALQLAQDAAWKEYISSCGEKAHYDKIGKKVASRFVAPRTKRYYQEYLWFKRECMKAHKLWLAEVRK